MTNPTVGDVIGGRKTIVQSYPVLATGLPNRMIVAGSRYDHIPESLQQRVTYSFTDPYSTNPPSASFAWSSINNEKLTLSFKPASQADEDALQSLLPEGEITDISQLPDYIPGYLVQVIPELKVNGTVKLSGAAMSLGQLLAFKTSIKHPGRSSQINYTYNIPAGSFVSVNSIACNVSSQKLTELQAQLTQTKTALESNDPAQIGNLTREDILGDMFYTGTLGYFAQLLGFNQIGALQANTQYYLAAGYGTFGYEPKVDYLFSLPTGIQAGGITLDIPLNIVTAHNAGDKQAEINYKLQTMIVGSTLEHATPEQLFNTDPANPANAFSAVKGLQIAASEGQRIYQVTAANKATTLPALNLDSGTLAEIQQAVDNGLEVITHTDEVSVPGYSGAGYIIFDPVTGDGAYKISGGQNGAFLAGFLAGLLHIAAMFFGTVGVLALIFPGAFLFGMVLLIGALIIYASYSIVMNAANQMNSTGGALGYNVALALVSVFGGPVGKSMGGLGKLTGPVSAGIAGVTGLVEVIGASIDYFSDNN